VYFFLKDKDHIEDDASNIYYIAASVFVAAGTCLPAVA
jgi:hypothetical protein